MILPVLFDIITCVLPLIVLFSGMAMNPVFVVMVVLIACGLRRADLRIPAQCLPEWRVMAGVLGILLLWPLLSTLWSISPERSLGASMRMLATCAAGLFAFTFAPALRAPSPRILRYSAYAILSCAVIVLLEKLPSGGLIRQLYSPVNYDRMVLKDINRGLCALTVLVWPVLTGLYQRGERQMAWSTALLLLVAILSMHSLSAKIGMIGSILAFFGMRHAPRFFIWALVLLVPLYLLAFTPLYLLLEQGFFTLPFVRGHLPQSSLARLDIWHELLMQASVHPILGWGMDTTRLLPISDWARSHLGWTSAPLHPHSPSMQLLLEIGAVGLVLFTAGLAYMLRLWQTCPRLDATARAFSGATITAYLVSGFSSFGIWQAWWIATLWVSGILWRRMASVPIAPAAFTESLYTHKVRAS